MNINVKADKEGKRVLAILCELIVVLSAYVMVFYFFWEGLLVSAGAK